MSQKDPTNRMFMRVGCVRFRYLAEMIRETYLRRIELAEYIRTEEKLALAYLSSLK